MNRVAVALTLAAAMAFAPVLGTVPSVEAKQPAGPGLSIPITGTGDTGQTFAGTFTLMKFVNDNGKVVAVGTVAGTVTDAAGKVVGTGLATVALPVSVPQGAAGTAAAVQPAAASCEILNLVLGPLDLNLLGLTVHLNQVVLNITAVPGAGNLLGNLLCSVAGLLDNPNGLAALLNQILDILNGLGV